MISGAWKAVLTPARIGVSVIALPLLPFAPREREIAEECREHQERDHRHRNGGALAEHAAGDAALERERRHHVRRVDRPAPGDGVDELEFTECEDDGER